MERMKILSEYSMRSIFASQSTGAFISDGSASSVELKLSSFRDINVYAPEGGLISGVWLRRETATDCLFKNISAAMGGQKEEWRRVKKEESIVRDSEIIGGENGIYGMIVCGVKDRIGGSHSFVSKHIC